MTAPVPLPTANRAGATAALANVGAVVSVRGSVVDVRFGAHLPPIYSVLREQVNASQVRGIALTPTQRLARGMAVEDTGGPLQVPVGKQIIGRMFDVFGDAIDHQPAPTDVQWRSVHRAPPTLRPEPNVSPPSPGNHRRRVIRCHFGLHSAIRSA